MSMSTPAPRQPVPVSQPPAPDRLLIPAICAWVIGMVQRIEAGAPIRVAFGRCRVPEAADAAPVDGAPG